MRRPPILTTTVELLDALDEWELVMRQLNRSPAHPRHLRHSVTQFDAHQRARQAPTVVDEIKPGDIRSYLVAVLDQHSASTAVTRWGGLLAFFKWATGEGLCDGNPMADVERPQRPELLTPVLTDDDIRAMLATCKGDFVGIRDNALMRFLLTTGCRRAECAGITLDDLDLKTQTVEGDGQGQSRAPGPHRGRHRACVAQVPAGPPAAPQGRQDRTTVARQARSAHRQRHPARSSSGAPSRPGSSAPTRTPGGTPSPTAGSPPAAPRAA